MEKVLSAPRGGSRWLFLWYWAPVLLYAALIFYFSSLPYPEDKLPDFVLKKVSDKLLHLVEYGVLGVCCYRAFRWAAGATSARYAVVFAIMASSFFGMTDEIHQAFVPFRESSWLDWVADTVGAAMGAVGSNRLSGRAAQTGMS